MYIYEEGVLLYLSANDREDPGKKRAILSIELLHHKGINIVAPVKVTEITLDEIVAKVKNQSMT